MEKKKRRYIGQKERKGGHGDHFGDWEKKRTRERILRREKRRNHIEKEKTRHHVCFFFLFACTFIHGIK